MKLRTKSQVVRIPITRGGETCYFFGEPINPKQMSKLLEKATDVIWEKGQRFSDLNLYRYKISKISIGIKGWEDVLDDDGNPIPFTPENLEIVYLNNPDIIDEVLEKLDNISKMKQIEEENELKNSKTAQPGTAIQ